MFFILFFSFDVRGRSFAKALHWSDRNAFGPRANFVTTMSPASLQLENVQLNDGGVYRCRVDFQSAPTRNFQINLTVIGEYLHNSILIPCSTNGVIVERKSGKFSSALSFT